MFKESSLSEQRCQPILAYCGDCALLDPKFENLNYAFSDLNFKNINSFFFYEIKICKFDAQLFSGNKDDYFAYLIEVLVKSDDCLENPYVDANVFLEENFEDLIEYAIILPRLFKQHHRYVIDMERDKVCSFKHFGEKISLWKKSNGLF